MKEIKTRRMRPTDLLRLATGSLAGNKLRTALTVAGIAIGVWVVVTVMTALSAMGTSINSGLAQLGSDTFQISKFPAIQIGGDGWWNYFRRPHINYRIARQFEQLMAEQGVHVAPNISAGGFRANYGDRRMKSRISITGTNENYLYTHNRDVDVGRFISAEDVLFRRQVAVIGSAMATELFPGEDPLGKRIIMDGQPYMVVGVMKGKGTVFGEDMDSAAVVPITVYIQYHLNRRWGSMNLAVQSPEPGKLAETQSAAIGTMRLVRGLEPEEENDFEVYSNDSLQSVFKNISTIVGTAGLLISAIALVTAGVGVMNIMLVSVTERTREIGVRKSIGARAKDILRQFLLEAVFIAQMGAMVGIAAGVGTGNAIATYALHVQAITPWFWMAAAVITCGGIGIGFGIYPAWRASRLDPVEALRYE